MAIYHAQPERLGLADGRLLSGPQKMRYSKPLLIKRWSWGVNDMRPRQYAAQIMQLKTREERKHYLDNVVPEHYKMWVKGYVEDWWKRGIKVNKDG